jgi:RNA polymerase sigma factor (sigma-70 family)
MLDVLPYREDFLLAQKCLNGDARALLRLQEDYRTALINYLIHVGASADEARILIDELWSDCVMDRPRRPPRLATYQGTAPLQGWLKVVALNKLIQSKRDLPPEDSAPGGDSNFDGLPSLTDDGSREPVESALLEIMRDAVQKAFEECEPADFVLLQLAHANGLRGRELAPMFGCSEATISRDLERARRSIMAAVLSHVRARDPWLELKWEDFIELCRVVSPACFGVE